MRRIRILLWIMVGLAIAAAGLLFLRTSEAPQQPQTVTIQYGGPFTLVGANGQPFPSSKLAGRPHALFFGFTNCPDVCPTTLARLVQLRRSLGKGDDSLALVFVTVDPERDGPAEVGRYAEQFGTGIVGLTGSPAQIAQVKKQFGIYSAKVPDESGDGYTVDHTATVLLFDRNGDFVGTISHEETNSVALAKLRRATA